MYDFLLRFRIVLFLLGVIGVLATVLRIDNLTCTVRALGDRGLEFRSNLVQ
jgi:hypothetical protein